MSHGMTGAPIPRPSTHACDVLIVGAGFYGCALAAHLAAAGKRVIICEAGDQPMQRASAVNQARIHTGFHYPRSFATALRSWHNCARFAEEFDAAVVRDFQMLYAIARHRSKVNAQRFAGMFEAMGAPIRMATSAQKALFAASMIEDVFACTEHAFDYTIIRRMLLDRMARLPVEILFRAEVRRIAAGSGGSLKADLADGRNLEAGEVFNITYSQINTVLKASGIPTLPLKHEFVEIALVEPPRELDGTAVTVLDGAFFSAMPYPSAKMYSLTHVRYTPHRSWTDADVRSPYEMADALPRATRWRHMMNDARRYMPPLGQSLWNRSLFDIKTVPLKNEKDDGRPILLHPHAELPGFYSVLGSKIDNIYDLFDALD